MSRGNGELTTAAGRWQERAKAWLEKAARDDLTHHQDCSIYPLAGRPRTCSCGLWTLAGVSTYQITEE